MQWWRLSSVFIILCLLTVFGCSDDSSDTVVEVDTPNDGVASLELAPSFTLANTELEEVSLSDYQGKVVLLDFWATWCKPCTEEIPLFIELSDEFRSQGFEMIGISLDDEGLKVVDPFIKKLGVNYTILLGDAETLNKYHVPAIPSAFLINRKGEIVKRFVGAQGEKAICEKELKELL